MIPLVTVIVVNFNGGDLLQSCVDSLSAQTSRNIEVIIVDNASSDGSIDRLAPMPANFKVIRSPENLGFAKANNLAAQEARGSWLALLNPDATAFPDWIERLLLAVERRPDFRIVASAQYEMGTQDRLDGVGDCYSITGYAWRGGFGLSTRVLPRAGEVFAACGASAFYPRDAFLAHGGFDETFFCFVEDVDLGFRLRLAGEKCQFDPTCRIYHAGSASTGKESNFSIFHGFRNTIWSGIKNVPWPLLFVVVPLWALVTALLLVRRPAARATRLAALRDAYAHRGPALRARAIIQSERKISLWDLCRSLSWNIWRRKKCLPDVRPFAAP